MPNDNDTDNLQMPTAGDICERLRINLRTLQAWRQKGVFPVSDLRVGKTLRWRVRTVVDWVETNRPSP
ncbi:MAG: helix-turn-helix domain-containing protein [Planctomycetota bacterium]